MTPTPRTILITGASGGFGRLTAQALLADGHHVIAGLRGGAERLGAVFSDAELGSGRLSAVDLHLDRPETFVDARRACVDGRLDVLINNAGYGALGPIEEQSEAEIRRQMEVNCVGPMLLTNALLPALRAARGRILNVTGAVGYAAFPFYALYCASKHALEGYSECLAHDLRPFGVQVGMVEPGGFRTGFIAAAAASTDAVPAASPYKARAAAMTAFLRREADKLGGDPQVVARTLVRLCTASSVPLRTRVGADAIALRALTRLVPGRARMWLIGAALEQTLFRPALP
jgi:NAD(P)-dependent dehydrogenase (short-subunit alcohol dehydrogenase family)